MSEEPTTTPSRKELLIAGLGAAAVLVLTPGTIVGVNASNTKTAELCTAATSATKATSFQHTVWVRG